MKTSKPARGEKRVKAWAVSNGYAPIEEGSGQFFVFSEQGFAEKSRYGVLKDYEVIPCTITYQVPKKKSR